MLEAVRKFSTSLIGKAVFILILVAFAGGFWYVGNPLAPGGGAWAIKVGDRPIAPSVVDIDYQRELQRLRQERGGAITREAARELGIRDRVIGSIVNGTLIDLAARDLGLVASDEQVRDAILANPGFHGPGGTFDRDVYAQTLALNGLNESRFEEIVREEIARQQLVSSLQSGAVPPPALTNFYYRVAAERRIIDYVTVSAADPASLPEPDEAALRDVYENRSLVFTAPEYRALTVAEIHVDDVAAEIQVTDAEIAAVFDERADEFSSPEKRTVRQIVVQDEALARRIHSRLREGGDFAAVAADEAGLSPDFLSLGTVEQRDMDAPVGAAAFALEVGDVSEPIQTVFGWTIVTVDAVEPSQLRPLTAVADSLRQDMAREKAADAVYDLAARLQDSLAGGTSLDQAAASLNLRLRRFDAVDGNGRDQSETAIPDLAPEIVRAAFRIEEGEESLLTDLGDDGSFIVRVDRVIPRTKKPFDEVRERASLLVRQQRARDGAREAAEDIAGRLRSGAEMEAAAAVHGLTAESTTAIDRSGENTELPMVMVEVFFDRPPGEVVVIPFAQVVVVGRVREFVVAEPGTADPATLTALRRVLTAQFREELAQQFMAALQQRYPVQVNDAILNEYF